jgi:hypothetical protein
MGGKQLGFSDYELTTAKKQTKREKFFSKMDVGFLAHRGHGGFEISIDLSALIAACMCASNRAAAGEDSAAMGHKRDGSSLERVAITFRLT